MNIWFTADHHFGHENIIKYCNRPFANAKEMDRELIRRWNERIAKDDTVYYVGDFTLADQEVADFYFSKLNGRVIAIQGSHDRWIEKRTRIFPITKTNSVYLEKPVFSVSFKTPSLKSGKGYLPIVLCHYAMRVWDRSHYGSWHLFGHSHGKLEPYGLSFDVGVDNHNFYPWSLDEVAEKMATLSPIEDYSKKHQ